jgi:ABC-type Mn2+/Zn2+ transport system ATPase subunit
MTHATAPPAPREAVDETILLARGLRLGYHGRTILDGVDLRIQRGEFWFVIGPNGQGKTTLLRAILGRLRPLAGRIERRGELACPEGMGFVPQQCGMNPTLPTTVREFVLLGLVGIRARAEERETRLAWALRHVELTGMESRDYWSLSGGQRQRALVARALVRRPRLLIADEPTSGFDLSVESALYASLGALNRNERLTVVLVTHDLANAARYGTHLALVRHGGIEGGPAQQVLRSGNLEDAYGVPIDVSQDASGSVNVRLGSRGPAT